MRIAVNANIIAFSGNYRQAGVSKYTENLVNGLAEIDRQNEYTVYVAAGPRPTDFANAPNFTVKASAFDTNKASLRIPWEQLVAPVAVLRDRPALLHCPLNVVPMAAPCPTIVTIHDLGFIRYPDRYKAAKRLYLNAATRLTARRARHILTDAEAIRQEVIELLGVRPDKVTSVPLGVDDRFHPYDKAEVSEFRRAKNLPARFVLYVGTLEPRKNVPLLLKGFARLRRERPDAVEGVHLVIGGGKGWLYEEIFKLVESLGLADVTTFPGYISDEELPLWYNSAECFVYPSVYEGFGLPPLEAMACGTPVITTNASSLPEVVGSAGIVLDPQDESGLAAGLVKLLTKPEQAAHYRQAGLEQAARFSWLQTARQTLDIYQSVAKG